MQKSQPELEQALSKVRTSLLARLDAGTLDAAQQRELGLALEELEVLWEEVTTQARLISRDRRRYARFFEHVPEACVITTPVGRISDANRAALQLLGTTSSKITGAPLAGFLADEARAPFLDFLSSLAGTRPDPLEQLWAGSIRTSDGALPVAMRMRAVTLANGGVRELCWLIRPSS
jgi:PAS domain S-box-containing protein